MVNQFQHPGTEKRSNTTENASGTLRLSWVCQVVEVGFKLLSERGNKWLGDGGGGGGGGGGQISLGRAVQTVGPSKQSYNQTV